MAEIAHQADTANQEQLDRAQKAFKHHSIDNLRPLPLQGDDPSKGFSLHFQNDTVLTATMVELPEGLGIEISLRQPEIHAIAMRRHHPEKNPVLIHLEDAQHLRSLRGQDKKLAGYVGLGIQFLQAGGKLSGDLQKAAEIFIEAGFVASQEEHITKVS